MVTHRIFRLLCRTCTPAVALSAALAGCVSPGTEGPVSTVMDHSTDIAARRDALRTVHVVDKAPAGSTKVDALAVRRCHRYALDQPPTEAAIVDDLKVAAYAQGGDVIRVLSVEKVPGLLANCWFVLEGRAEVYRLGR